MSDQGAMGTLLVGLDAVRREAERDRRPATVRRGADRDRRPSPATAPRARPGIRMALARGLRRAAEWLDQPAIREAAAERA
jgi:hypothetical protein